MNDKEIVKLQMMNLSENDSPECHLLVRCGWRLYADGFWRHKGMPDREHATQDAVDITTMRGAPTEPAEDDGQ